MIRYIAALLLSTGVSVADARQIKVVGTGDGMELVNAVGSAFTAQNPDSVIHVPPSIGSGGGIAAVGSGKADIARVARALKPSEVDSGLVEQPVFRLPTAIYVNAGLPVNSLTHQQLKAIYEGKTRNWSEVGGPDIRVRVVRREDTDSSLGVLRKSMPGWNDIEITSRSKTAVTTQDAVETVKSVVGAIGFGPFSRKLEASTKVLSIDGSYPTDGQYPTAVTVAYVWRKGDIADDVQAFVDFAGSKKAYDLLMSLGAVPAKNIQE